MAVLRAVDFHGALGWVRFWVASHVGPGTGLEDFKRPEKPSGRFWEVRVVSRYTLGGPVLLDSSGVTPWSCE